MPARLDPRPLFNGLISGLRERRNIGHEPEDRVTKLVLIGFPIGLFIASLAAGLQFPNGDQLIAGSAIFIGALLASFAQLANWRERLTARGLKIEGVKMRAVDEAVAHVLVATIMTTGMTGALILEVNASSPWVRVPASSFAFAVMAYLALTLLIVVNLLWDAYQDANPPSKPLARPDPGEDQEKAG